jgi:hypothetical protein
VCFPKGGDHVGTEGARVRKTLWDERYEHDGTKLQKFPVAASPPLDLAIALDTLAAPLQDASPSAVCARWTPDREDVANASAAFATLRRFMIAYQEELDWRTYRLYGLLDAPAEALDPASIPEVDAGERAFEIVMARRIAAGELDTVWFERHGTIPITDIPFEWPEPYRQLVQRRIDLIASNPAIDLIERPEYKRRWNTEPFEEQLQRALRSWLLDRLESPTFWPSTTDPRLQTCARLADIAGQDPDFMQVAALYRGREDFDVTKLVTELVESEAVPYLPVLRYKPAGRLKREAWEETWTLQREEDAVDARTRLPVNHPDRVEPDQAEKLKAASIGTIPVPPKYASSDFLSATLWRLRGKLDVPKERFVSYPFAEREVDPTPVVAWAGWDHLQQARALAAYYTEMKDHEGWSEERRLPLLLGLQELVPWLLQWHNDLDPAFGIGLGDFFRDFVENEARAMGKTVEDLRAYEPPKRTRGRGRKPKEKRA